MDSTVDDDSQFQLDSLWNLGLVKTGKHVCDVVRSSKTSSQTSSGIGNRLKTAE